MTPVASVRTIWPK